MRYYISSLQCVQQCLPAVDCIMGNVEKNIIFNACINNNLMIRGESIAFDTNKLLTLNVRLVCAPKYTRAAARDYS